MVTTVAPSRACRLPTSRARCSTTSKLLATPELVARTWAAAKREGRRDYGAGGHDPARRLRHGLERAVPRRAGADRPAPGRAGRHAGGHAGGADEDRGAGEPGRRVAAAGRKEGGMIQSAETRLDGTTLVVRIPMRFQREGPEAHRRADGSAIAPTTKPQPDSTLVKALARAWRWQKLLDDGVYASVSEIGDAESISKSYVTGSYGWLVGAGYHRGDPRRQDGSGYDAGEAGAAAAGELGGAAPARTRRIYALNCICGVRHVPASMVFEADAFQFHRLFAARGPAVWRARSAQRPSTEGTPCWPSL